MIDTTIGIITQDDTLVITRKGLGGCDLNTKDFIPPFNHNVFILDETKCKTYNKLSKNEGEGPFGISNYVTKKISDTNFRFTYVFENEEFNGVINCG